MGALAVATLAGAELALAAHRLHVLPELEGLLRGVDLATWSLASLLILPLLAAEMRNRGGREAVGSRWSFVFPLGMFV